MTVREEGFSNRQVDLASLPDYRKVTLSPVAPGYRAWAQTTQTGFWMLLAVLLLFVPFVPFVSIDWVWWIALPVGSLLIGLITAVYFVVDARIRAWAVREHDLVYRYGLFWRKTVILPFSRIQHVEALQGPVERYFDLMRLKCFTAGGLSADLLVRGLDSASARRVRGFLLEQISASAESGSDAEVDAGDE